MRRLQIVVNRLLTVVMLPICLTGCTLSFSNVDTHGTASDLIDEQQAASPTVSPDIQVPIPIKPM